METLQRKSSKVLCSSPFTVHSPSTAHYMNGKLNSQMFVPDRILQELIVFARNQDVVCLTDEFLHFVIRPELSVLSLHNCPSTVTSHFLSRELEETHIQGLQTLAITNCGHLAELDIFVDRVGKICHEQLTEVDLSGSLTLTDTGVENLTRHSVRLRKLDLSRCPLLEWSFLGKLSGKDGVTKKLGQLEFLALGCPGAQVGLSDQCLSMFLRELAGADRNFGLGNLTTLNLPGCHINTLTVQVLSMLGQNIEELCLDDTGISDAQLRVILKKCRKLRSLSLNGANPLSFSGLELCFALPRLCSLAYTINNPEMPLPPVPPPERVPEWQCNRCTLKNAGLTCAACECPRPESAPNNVEGSATESNDQQESEEHRYEVEENIRVCPLSLNLKVSSLELFPDDQTLDKLFESLPSSLVQLKLDICFPETLRLCEVINRNSQLECLHYETNTTSSANIQMLQKCVASLPYLSELRATSPILGLPDVFQHSGSSLLHLDLCVSHDINQTNEDWIISLNSLQTLQLRGTKFCKLDVTECQNLKSLKLLAVVNLEAICAGDTLESLEVTGEFQGTVLNEIGSKYSLLWELALTYEGSLQIEFQREVLGTFPCLASCHFKGFTLRLTDDVIDGSSPFSGQISLMTIKLHGSIDVTSELLNTLAKTLPNLKVLELIACINLKSIESILQVGSVEGNEASNSICQETTLSAKESFYNDVHTTLKRLLDPDLKEDSSSVSFPLKLAASQRKVIHDMSEELSQKHEEYGTGEERFVKVWKEDSSVNEANAISTQDFEYALQCPRDHCLKSQRQLKNLLKMASQLPREKSKHGQGRPFCLRFQRDSCPFKVHECQYSHSKIAGNKLKKFRPLLDFSCTFVPRSSKQKKKEQDGQNIEDYNQIDNSKQDELPENAPEPLMFRKLQQLLLFKCNRLTGVSIQGPELVSIRCCFCPRLSAFDASTPKLCDLDLSNCPVLSNIPLHHNSFRRLERFSLNGCRLLQQPLMDKIVLHCQNLRRLVVYNTGAALAAANLSGSAASLAAKEKGRSKKNDNERVKTKTSSRLKGMTKNRPNLDIIYTKRQFKNERN